MCSLHGQDTTVPIVERTLPWGWYADPDVLRLEGDRIFGRTWQYVGHVGQVGEGGFVAATAGQMPVVVTRTRDGELRAFRGRLEIAVDAWGPLIFVNPDRDSGSLAAALGDVPARVAEILDVKALEFRFRSEFELDVNWKISCENFLECYHCAVAHPGFSAVVDVSPDAYLLDSEGLVSSQVGPLRADGASSFGDGEVPRSQFHFLWPNFSLNIFPGHPNLSCGPMIPLGPERTGRFLDYFFAPDVDQTWVDELVAFDTQVGAEDRALVEGVQRGVRSGVLAEGRLLSQSEQLVVHFQRLCAEALAS
jgi:phenylpropionate dioxygenase-like ring-hydroxylating dioxygenase large terminal subunit